MANPPSALERLSKVFNILYYVSKFLGYTLFQLLQELISKKNLEKSFIHQGNFKPVLKEITCENLPITGQFPSDFPQGLYIRNGPNPRFLNQNTPQHWFDGDGMLHSVNFELGPDAIFASADPPQPNVTYRNRFVKTKRLGADIRANKSVHRVSLGALMTPLTFLKMMLPQFFPILRNPASSSQPVASGTNSINAKEILKNPMKKIDIKSTESWSKNLINESPDLRAIDTRRDKDGYLVSGRGSANTSFIYHSGLALAIVESAIPTVVSLPDLETVGVHTFGNALNSKCCFTAHPKVDCKTGEMFSFGYYFQPNPLDYYKMDKNGRVVAQFKIPYGPVPHMLHEFGLSQNYAIVLDFPLEYNVLRFTQGKQPLFFNTKGKTRFGMIPRNATSADQVFWIDSKIPSYLFHVGATYEYQENNATKIRIIGCRASRLDFLPDGQNSFELVESWNKDSVPTKEFATEGLPAMTDHVLPDSTQSGNHFDKFSGNNIHQVLRLKNSVLYEWILNLDTRIVEKEGPLIQVECEFPTQNEHTIGAKNQFIYCAMLKSVPVETLEREFQGKKTEIKLNGFFKYDCDSNKVVGSVVLDENEYCGEVVFVPKKGWNPVTDREDDGFLITHVTNEQTMTTKTVIWSAKTLSLTSSVALSQRVPHGFHGHWLSKDQIQYQRINLAENGKTDENDEITITSTSTSQ